MALHGHSERRRPPPRAPTPTRGRTPRYSYYNPKRASPPSGPSPPSPSQYVFGRNKYGGRKFADVAQLDPRYLAYLNRPEKRAQIDDEALLAALDGHFTRQRDLLSETRQSVDNIGRRQVQFSADHLEHQARGEERLHQRFHVVVDWLHGLEHQVDSGFSHVSNQLDGQSSQMKRGVQLLSSWIRAEARLGRWSTNAAAARNRRELGSTRQHLDGRLTIMGNEQAEYAQAIQDSIQTTAIDQTDTITRAVRTHLDSICPGGQRHGEKLQASLTSNFTTLLAKVDQGPSKEQVSALSDALQMTNQTLVACQTSSDAIRRTVENEVQSFTRGNETQFKSIMGAIQNLSDGNSNAENLHTQMQSIATALGQFRELADVLAIQATDTANSQAGHATHMEGLMDRLRDYCGELHAVADALSTARANEEHQLQSRVIELTNQLPGEQPNSAVSLAQQIEHNTSLNTRIRELEAKLREAKQDAADVTAALEDENHRAESLPNIGAAEALACQGALRDEVQSLKEQVLLLGNERENLISADEHLASLMQRMVLDEGKAARLEVHAAEQEERLRTAQAHQRHAEAARDDLARDTLRVQQGIATSEQRLLQIEYHGDGGETGTGISEARKILTRLKTGGDAGDTSDEEEAPE